MNTNEMSYIKIDYIHKKQKKKKKHIYVLHSYGKLIRFIQYGQISKTISDLSTYSEVYLFFL